MSIAISILRAIESLQNPLPIPSSYNDLQIDCSSFDSVQWDSNPEPAERIVLDSLHWNACEFALKICHESESCGYLPVEFTSPNTNFGNAMLRWYPAQSIRGQTQAPACLLLHETGNSMIAAVSLARGLAKRGIHAFLLVAAGYGERSSYATSNILSWFQGTIREARRARDVIASLPTVEPNSISLMGVSLGGFIGSVTGALDTAFAEVFLILCGVDLYGILKSGDAHAREWLQRLHSLGMSNAEIERQCSTVEPERVVHRLNPTRTHLFSARYDQVVRPKYSDRLATSIGLPESHHHRMNCTHYSGVIYLPWITKLIARRILSIGQSRT